MRELLEAGVHYGHHTSRWNPKMAPYIYKRRHNIHVIDLRQTVRGLVRAHRFLSAIGEQGGEVILVGTKRQARNAVEEQARRAGAHWVSERWLGGMLTNFSVVMGRVRRLDELERIAESGEIESRGKKYASVLRRELGKLRKNLGGVRNMRRLPDAVIIIDPRREKSALREANSVGIPVIAFMDTDSDPDMVDIVIPGNDDAMRSVQLICSKLMDALIEGRSRATTSADGADVEAAEPFGVEPIAPPSAPPGFGSTEAPMTAQEGEPQPEARA